MSKTPEEVYDLLAEEVCILGRCITPFSSCRGYNHHEVLSMLQPLVQLDKLIRKVEGQLLLGSETLPEDLREEIRVFAQESLTWWGAGDKPLEELAAL